MHCLGLLLVDLILVSVSTLIATVLCSMEAPLYAVPAAGWYCAIALAVAVPVLFLFRLNRTLWRFTALGDAVRVAAAVTIIVVSSAMLGHYTGRLTSSPTTVPVMQGLLMFYALGGARVAMRIRHDARTRRKRFKAIANAHRENVLIVGLSPLADLFLHSVAKSGGNEIEIVGILSSVDRHHGRLLRSRRILGAPEAIHDVMLDLAIHGVIIDRIVMASPLSELTENAQEALLSLRKSGKVHFDDLSGHLKLSADAARSREPTADTGGDTIELPLNPYLRWKRVIDAVVALVCVIAFAPLMLVVFIVVLLDVGAPVIFWQQRPGARGRPINVLKFRTMRSARARDGRVLLDAERISRTGHLLRRLRLDELPQVYNVLLGHMSLVGPRPLLPIDQPSAPYARLQLRPGLTGWAQIKGGRHISSEDKAALDLWYIRNASFALDMMILAHTIRMVLFGDKIDRNAIQEAWIAIRNDQISLLSVQGPGQTPI